MREKPDNLLNIRDIASTLGLTIRGAQERIKDLPSAYRCACCSQGGWLAEKEDLKKIKTYKKRSK